MRRPKRAPFFAGLACVLLVTLGLSGTVTDVACAGCHGGLGASVTVGHKGVRCYECHTARTIDGLLAAKGSEIAMLSAAAIGSETTRTPTAPPRGACLACHADVLMGTIERGGLRVNHGTCADVEQACIDCHWGVGHDSAERPGRGIAMDRCMECHDDITASWDCETCHLDSGHADRPSVGSWAVTHGPEWRRAHGMGDMDTCGACHDSALCESCHGVALPHPGGYVNGKHGDEARPDTRRCTACHRQSFCDDCHGVEMPHPEGFLPTHSSIVGLQGDAVCATCHVLEDCDLCHVSHVHPGHL